MSGHGGFSVTGQGMNRPQVFDPSKAEEIKIGGGKLDALNIEGRKPGAPAADTRLDQANRVISTLDMLLLKAAKAASAPVDVKALKAAASDAKLDKAARRAIENAAKQAHTTFKAINRFTGRQIASALVKDESGAFDWDVNSPAGKAIKAALDAQAELSEALGEALNSLPPKTAGRSALMEAMLQTDRRASEIQTLVCDFADMAEKDGTDPEVSARLDRTLKSLIPSQSLKMHGNEKLAADFRASLAPLAKKIDDLAAQKERQLSDNEAVKIGRQIDEAFNALVRAEQSYFQKGSPPDSSLMASAKKVLVDFNTRLASIRREAALASMRNFAARTFLPPKVGIFQEKFLPLMAAITPWLVTAMKTQQLLKAAADDFIAGPNNDNLKRMNELADNLASLSGRVKVDLAKLKNNEIRQDVLLDNLIWEERSELDDIVRSLPQADQRLCTPKLLADFRKEVEKFLSNRERDLGSLNAVYDGIGGIKTQTDHLVEMYRNAGNYEKKAFLTNKTLRAAFEGKMEVTTLIETRMSGLPDEDAAPALDGSNAVSSRALGSGAVNTVYEVGYKDGSTYIFKPEAPGRQGLDTLRLAEGSYGSTQLVAQLNMAAQKTADAFGLGDVMTKTSVGSYNGQFGLFMEKAPGCEASDFKKTQKETPGSLTAAQIKSLGDEQYARVIGEIMRKTNRLEWFDILTAQGDRHHHNYMLNVGEDGKVSVKGIDNDACFGVFMVGPGRFLLKGSHADSFEKVLNKVKTGLYPGGASHAQKSRIDQDPGVHRLPNGSYYVDTSKINAPELHYCLGEATGCHLTSFPEYMDEDFYNHLMKMESGSEEREAYIADLRKRLPLSAVNVAVNRLDSVIKLAKSYKESGRVVPAEDWSKRGIQRKIAGKLPQIDPKAANRVLPSPLKKVEGHEPHKNNFAREVADTVSKSTWGLFRRDLMAHIAKPGWFEE